MTANKYADDIPKGKIDRKCIQCGEYLSYKAGPQERWCANSKECGNGGFRAWYLARHPEYPFVPKEARACRHCGKPVTGQKGIPSYCSEECRQAARDERDEERPHKGSEAARAAKPHGLTRYKHGCRCEICVTANREAQRRYYYRTKAKAQAA